LLTTRRSPSMVAVRLRATSGAQLRSLVGVIVQDFQWHIAIAGFDNAQTAEVVVNPRADLLHLLRAGQVDFVEDHHVGEGDLPQL
jgi:hypothetical protein